MNVRDLEATVRRFASDYGVLLVMAHWMAEHGEFDRAGVTSTYGPATPRTLKRFCDAGLIENKSRPKGRGKRRTYYTMPDYVEIRRIVESAGWRIDASQSRISVRRL
jgi:hypothetical protein